MAANLPSSSAFPVRILSSSHLCNYRGYTELTHKLINWYEVPSHNPNKQRIELEISAQGGRKLDSEAQNEILRSFQSGKLVIVLLGDNDARSISDPVFDEQVNRWIERFNDFADQIIKTEVFESKPGWIIFISVLPMIEDIPPHVVQAADRFTLEFDKLARKTPNRVGYIDLCDYLTSPRKIYKMDAIHLNTTGQDAVFDVFRKIIDIMAKIQGSEIELSELALFYPVLRRRYHIPL